LVRESETYHHNIYENQKPTLILIALKLAGKRCWVWCREIAM